MADHAVVHGFVVDMETGLRVRLAGRADKDLDRVCAHCGRAYARGYQCDHVAVRVCWPDSSGQHALQLGARPAEILTADGAWVSSVMGPLEFPVLGHLAGPVIPRRWGRRADPQDGCTGWLFVAPAEVRTPK